MLSKDLFTIAKNQVVARDVLEMVLEGPTAAITNPGQFIDIRLEQKFLRRRRGIGPEREEADGVLTRFLRNAGNRNDGSLRARREGGEQRGGQKERRQEPEGETHAAKGENKKPQTGDKR